MRQFCGWAKSAVGCWRKRCAVRSRDSNTPKSGTNGFSPDMWATPTQGRRGVSTSCRHLSTFLHCPGCKARHSRSLKWLETCDEGANDFRGCPTHSHCNSRGYFLMISFTQPSTADDHGQLNGCWHGRHNRSRELVSTSMPSQTVRSDPRGILYRSADCVHKRTILTASQRMPSTSILDKSAEKQAQAMPQQ